MPEWALWGIIFLVAFGVAWWMDLVWTQLRDINRSLAMVIPLLEAIKDKRAPN